MGRGQDSELLRNKDHNLSAAEVIEASPLPLLLFSDQGEILLSNERAQNFFSYEGKDLLRLRIDDLLLQPCSINHLKKQGEKESYLSFLHSPDQRMHVAAKADTSPGQHLWTIKSGYDISLQPRLSGRESQILDLLADGANNGQIAHGIGIARATAQQHIASLRDKLEASTRAQIIERAMRHEIIHPRQDNEISFIEECCFFGEHLERAHIRYIDANTHRLDGKLVQLLNEKAENFIDGKDLQESIYRSLQQEEREYFVDKSISFPWRAGQYSAEGWIDPLPGDRVIIRLRAWE